MTNILDAICKPNNELNINKNLDFIYSNIEDLLFEKKIDNVNTLLGDINIKNTDPLILLCVLTATDPWKETLKNRKKFYFKVKNKINKLYTKDKAKELLFDLK